MSYFPLTNFCFRATLFLMISISRPSVFFLLFLLAPAFLYMSLRFHRLVRSLGGLYGNGDAHNATAFRRLKRAFMGKVILRGLCWIFLVFAFAGISWGKKTVPVQKNGNAFCFVFDISYSMNAPDAGNGLTRLDAARQYANMLLDAMGTSSVSVVLAKGDGVLALPLTEDRAAIQSLLDSLSPQLMTATGSSIGRGIETALNAFPHNSAQNAHVWVFTDGDETDGALQSALDDAVRFCIPVSLIGFGSGQGTEVVAGDGKTKVHTALNAEKLIAAANRANEKNVIPMHKNHEELIQYVQATEKGSASRLLRPLSLNSSDMGSDITYAYEVQQVDRHGIFLLVALICFVLSFIAGEADILSLRHTSALSSVSLVVCMLTPILLASCNISGSQSILHGTWAWYQKKYEQATAIFLRTHQNSLARQDTDLSQYALFALSATYLAQEEYDAALSRLQQLAPDAPSSLKSAALYNEGIIAYHNGDNAKAIACFKEAILSDGTNVNAKINLEFCQTEESMRQTKGAEKEMQQVSETKDDSALEKGVFTLIKENEQNQWKKLQANQKESSALDY